MKSNKKKRMLAVVLCMVIALSNSSFIFASTGSEQPAAAAQEGSQQNTQEGQEKDAVQDTPKVLSEEATAEPTQEPEVTEVPEPAVTETPEPTDMPEVTPAATPETPQITEMPETTPEADLIPTETPEAIETPTETPEPTQEPEVTDAPETMPEATPVPTEAPVKSNEATELKQEFKDENGNVTAVVTAQIPAGAFQADASELTMEVTVPERAVAEHVKKLMEESLPEHYMLGDTVFYDIRFKVNGTETESQQPIMITFENQNGITVRDVKKAVVFRLDPADPAVEGDKDELITITQRNDMIESLKNSGQSTEHIDDYDLSEITLKEDGTSDQIRMEGRTSTIYGCYTYYEPVQVLTYEDDQVIVTVSAAEDGIIPADAELKVVPITEDRETEDQYKDVEKKLREKAEKDEYDIAGFLAYDITFVDPDGNETEPGGEVKVSLDYKKAAIPESVSEEDAQNAEVTVLHLEEDEKGDVKEVVDMAQNEKVDVLATTEENKIEKAEVRTESFSVYTITWRRVDSIYVHYVDSEGKDISENNMGGEPGNINVKDTKWHSISGNSKDSLQLDVDISGYEYDYAYVQDKGNNARYLRKDSEGRLRYSNNQEEDGSYWNQGNAYVENGRRKYGYHLYLVYEADSSSQDGLTTVETVDSTSEGITMRMIDMDGNTDDYTIWKEGSQNTTKIDLGGGYTPGSIKRGLLESTLDSNGYPVTTGENYYLNNKGEISYSQDGVEGKNLNKLFSGGQTVNHLFRKDIYDETGYFEYSSFENYAYLNNNGNFTVYDQIGTPDQGSRNSGANDDTYFYQRGNFMPYNPIQASNKSYNRNYYDEYGNGLDRDDPRYGETLYKTVGNNNYQFGMYMEANFLQPQDGIVDKTNDDMIFEFNGDDDLWIYIDGVLVLDIGGVHDAHSGKINFATGEVTIYDSTTGNTTRETRETTLAKLFEEAKKMPDINGNVAWNNELIEQYFNVVTEDGKEVITGFKDYSTHQIKMFYMERGAGASNLHMKFNLQVVPEGTVEVAKNLDNTNKDKYANEKFTFELYVQEKADDWTEDEPVYEEGNYIQVTEANISSLGLSTVLEQSGNELPGANLEWSEKGDQFYLKPDQSVVFSGLKATQKYFVKEVGVESNRYDEIIINSVTVTETDDDDLTSDTIYTDENGVSNITTSAKEVYERPMVAFTNSCSDENSVELRIEKLMKEGQTSNDTFEFYVELESTDGSLQPYNGYYYLIKWDDGVRKYYYYDRNGNLTEHGAGGSTEGDEIVDPDHRYACGETTNGVIPKVPVGYTVVITGLVSGTSFKVEEHNISAEYSQTPIKKIKEGTYNIVDGADGETVLDRAVEMTITNSYAHCINVEKQWIVSDDVNTDSNEIYVGLYYNDSPVTDRYLLLDHGNQFSGSFTALTEIDYTKYSVKELRPARSGETADFTIDSTGYVGIQQGTSITIDGIQFVVDYEALSPDTADTSQFNAVINNVQKWQIIKQSTSSANKLLGGAKFNLTWKGETATDMVEDNDITYTGESQENTGIIQWKDATNQEFTEIFKDGFYILTEVEAPTGYSLGHEWEITITNGIPTAINEIVDQGNRPIIIRTDAEGIITVYYKNTPIFDLPSAGGPGIFWYLMGGTMLMMAGSFILYRMKRREVLGS